MKNKWLLMLLSITIIVSVFIFIKYKGYKGMFDSFNKNEIPTPKVEVIEQTPIIEEPKIDTLYIYRVIVGSFKDLENAQLLSDSIPFSDILETDDGWYRLSKSYHFDWKDAKIERDLLGEDVWVLKDSIFLEQ